MTRKRTPVPAQIAATVMFEADRACCVCEAPGGVVQIHHLDGDPRNHEPDNLVLLCLNHHEEAGRTSRAGRSLSRELLCKYRDAWGVHVRAKRQAALERPVFEQSTHDAQLEALACHDVRKWGRTITTDNFHVDRASLHEVARYAADSWQYGAKLRSEVLSVAQEVAGLVRRGTTPGVLDLVVSIAENALPVTSLVHPSSHGLSAEDATLFGQATDVGWTLAYNGVRYLKDRDLVEGGSKVLWRVIRYARLNQLTDLEMEAREYFDRVIAIAEEKKLVGLQTLSTWWRDDALEAP